MTLLSSSPPASVASARKYRPTTFSDLVGQEFLVETLIQCLLKQRLPHAFLFHGMRGVGKTTTARILARALNCEGKDGSQTTPTTEPCGVCSSCLAIAEDRHMDVIEMDAASRTGVDDIREVIEAARYKPVQGRFKIYIIDEVHMLSKSAFNALLKTLEEPPLHVKFIFATTEVRKIPDTILSRSMRFDLQRLEPAKLAARLKHVATQEGAQISEEALVLLTRAAEGSLRDGLSLLDQAIALSDGVIEDVLILSMLGLVDRSQLFRLIKSLFAGDVPAFLALHRQLYTKGADPRMLLSELLELIYAITTLKAAPTLKESTLLASLMPEGERAESANLANSLSLPILMRAWQVLLKGADEISKASNPFQALEMLLIRFAYLADLPPLTEMISRPQASGVKPQDPGPKPQDSGSPVKKKDLPNKIPQSFAELLELVSEAREPLLCAYLQAEVHLVDYQVGKIILRFKSPSHQQELGALRRLLKEKTDLEWVIEHSPTETGETTITDQKKQAQAEIERQSLENPLVSSILHTFPGAKASLIKDS